MPTCADFTSVACRSTFCKLLVCPTLIPFLGLPPPKGSYLSLDGKVTKDQGCTEFAKNQIFGLEIKELAMLKQLLFLAILQIGFFTLIQ